MANNADAAAAATTTTTAPDGVPASVVLLQRTANGIAAASVELSALPQVSAALVGCRLHGRIVGNDGALQLKRDESREIWMRGAVIDAKQAHVRQLYLRQTELIEKSIPRLLATNLDDVLGVGGEGEDTKDTEATWSELRRTYMELTRSLVTYQAAQTVTVHAPARLVPRDPMRVAPHATVDLSPLLENVPPHQIHLVWLPGAAGVLTPGSDESKAEEEDDDVVVSVDGIGDDGQPALNAESTAVVTVPLCGRVAFVNPHTTTVERYWTPGLDADAPGQDVTWSADKKPCEGIDEDVCDVCEPIQERRLFAWLDQGWLVSWYPLTAAPKRGRSSDTDEEDDDERSRRIITPAISSEDEDSGTTNVAVQQVKQNGLLLPLQPLSGASSVMFLRGDARIHAPICATTIAAVKHAPVHPCAGYTVIPLTGLKAWPTWCTSATKPLVAAVAVLTLAVGGPSSTLQIVGLEQAVGEQEPSIVRHLVPNVKFASLGRTRSVAGVFSDGFLFLCGGTLSLTAMQAINLTPQGGTQQDGVATFECPPMRVGRCGHAMFVRPGAPHLLYVVGGTSKPPVRRGDLDGSTSVEVFDWSTLQWSTGPSMTMPRSFGMQVVTLDTGRVLVIGGDTARQPCGAYFETAEELDWTTNTWRRIPTWMVPPPRNCVAVPAV